jgi:hypothetical protein
VEQSLVTVVPAPKSLSSNSLTKAASESEGQRQLLAVLWFLRKRYAADPAETEMPITSFTDSDIRELLDCFGQEILNMVHTEKAKQESLQLGGGKKVHFARPFSSVGNSVTQTFSFSPVPSTGPASSNADSTPLPQPVAYFSRPLSTMTLKDALVILRRGETVVKYSAAHSKPAYRFLSVRDGRVLFNNELVLMPLLCWSVSEHATPSNQLELCLLSDVGRSVPQTIVKDTEGQLPPVTPGESSVSPTCFVSLFFPSRRVDAAFKSKEIADCWTVALKLVAAKNKA